MWAHSSVTLSASALMSLFRNAGNFVDLFVRLPHGVDDFLFVENRFLSLRLMTLHTLCPSFPFVFFQHNILCFLRCGRYHIWYLSTGALILYTISCGKVKCMDTRYCIQKTYGTSSMGRGNGSYLRKKGKNRQFGILGFQKTNTSRFWRDFPGIFPLRIKPAPGGNFFRPAPIYDWFAVKFAGNLFVALSASGRAGGEGRGEIHPGPGGRNSLCKRLFALGGQIPPRRGVGFHLLFTEQQLAVIGSGAPDVHGGIDAICRQIPVQKKDGGGDGEQFARDEVVRSVPRAAGNRRDDGEWIPPFSGGAPSRKIGGLRRDAAQFSPFSGRASVFVSSASLYARVSASRESTSRTTS